MSDLLFLVDIGTTTISGAIVSKDRILVASSILNGQIRFGDNVISRIEFALKDPKNAHLLSKATVSSINSLLARLLTASSKRPSDIKKVFCVCNTAIHHLFLEIDPAPLITPPYKAKQKSGVTVYAGRVGIRLNKDSPVTFLPNIDGFVGSDALAVIIAGDIYKSVDIRLAIDIGTNGEVILGNKDKILVASTAAGPAFEGRHISCGMPAIDGAIEAVKIDKKGIRYKVIGGKRPKGICGSGLIEACYQMLKYGIIDRSGRMRKGHKFKICRNIFITQQDIRRLQLAKAAIYAAIKILIRRFGIGEKDIREILITGSFGNIVNQQSLVGIGLLPRIEISKIRFIKNGALNGLMLYTTKPHVQKEILPILSKTRHAPLLGRGFSEEFTSSMSIGG